MLRYVGMSIKMLLASIRDSHGYRDLAHTGTDYVGLRGIEDQNKSNQSNNQIL